MRQPLELLFITSFLVAGLSGCANISYLAQAGRGQFALWNKSKPIEEWLENPTLSENKKALLREVPAIKAYGESYGIKPTGSYRTYIQLDQDSVVYAVSACESLEFKVKTWSFPILGSVPYLGFFKKEAALQYAESLRADKTLDLDVDVRGVPAYSTLGWFTDPLLSSMLSEGDDAIGELAEVILHESLHATLYISHQSPFNESLATFVGQRLARNYLKAKRGEKSKEYLKYEEGLDRSQKVAQSFSDTARELKFIYQTGKSRDEKLAEKGKLLVALQEKFHLRRPVNNAALSQYLTYTEGTLPFRKYFEEKCGADWRKFLSSLSRIKQESFAVPQQENLAPVLQSLDCQALP